MTEPREATAALPLSLTCSPDERFADALHALVSRVGALAAARPGEGESFTAAFDSVVGWLIARRQDVVGDVAIRFDRDGDRLLGQLRWVAADGARTVPDTDTVASADVEVACDVHGPEVHCRVSCRCV